MSVWFFVGLALGGMIARWQAGQNLITAVRLRQEGVWVIVEVYANGKWARIMCEDRDRSLNATRQLGEIEQSIKLS